MTLSLYHTTYLLIVVSYFLIGFKINLTNPIANFLKELLKILGEYYDIIPIHTFTAQQSHGMAAIPKYSEKERKKETKNQSKKKIIKMKKKERLVGKKSERN